MRRVCVLALVALLAVSVSGCGRSASPNASGGGNATQGGNQPKGTPTKNPGGSITIKSGTDEVTLTDLKCTDMPTLGVRIIAGSQDKDPSKGDGVTMLAQYQKDSNPSVEGNFKGKHFKLKDPTGNIDADTWQGTFDGPDTVNPGTTYSATYQCNKS